MSRTTVHEPWRLHVDIDGWWTRETYKHWNRKGTDYARRDRRLIRHAPIDEDETALVNALAEAKSDPWAWNKYW